MGWTNLPVHPGDFANAAAGNHGHDGRQFETILGGHVIFWGSPGHEFR